MTRFIVTEQAMRPASSERRCFYCGRDIGEEHAADCALVHRRAIVRAVIEYEVEIPAHWDAQNVEFHRNGSSWCQGNMIQELEQLEREHGCMCAANVHFEFLRFTDREPYLDEK